MPARIAFVLALAVTLTACAGGAGEPPRSPGDGDRQRACTLIGCDSSLTFRSERAAALLAGEEELTVTACLDGDCATATVPPGECSRPGPAPLPGGRIACPPGGVALLLPDPGSDLAGSDRHTASLTITGEGGRTLLDDQVDQVDFTATQPNGPDCPPTCYSATVELAG